MYIARVIESVLLGLRKILSHLYVALGISSIPSPKSFVPFRSWGVATAASTAPDERLR